MTVSSIVNKSTYTGTGSLAEYAYGFRIFAATDLVVVETDADGVETTLELNVDYSVSGVGEETGTITLGSNLTAGHILTIRRIRPLLQETDIRNQGAFFPDIHEDALDHQIMVDQQQQDDLDRSLKLPEAETGPITLPSESERASKFLAFDADGEPIASEGVVNSVPVTSFIETVLDDANATAARATLGAASASDLSDLDALLSDSIAELDALGKWETGDIKWTAKASPSAGWLIANGNTIGSAASGATARANADTADLFTELWGGWDNLSLPIQDSAGSATARGASAAADFAANKRLPLPDLRRRVAVGAGGTATATLNNVLGYTGGAETHTLITAELPPHQHSEVGNVASSFNTDGSGASAVLASSGTGLTGAAGSGTAHNNIQPSIVLNAFIKL